MHIPALPGALNSTVSPTLDWTRSTACRRIFAAGAPASGAACCIPIRPCLIWNPNTEVQVQFCCRVAELHTSLTLQVKTTQEFLSIADEVNTWRRHLHMLLDIPLNAPGLKKMKMETRTVENPQSNPPSY